MVQGPVEIDEQPGRRRRNRRDLEPPAEGRGDFESAEIHAAMGIENLAGAAEEARVLGGNEISAVLAANERLQG